MSVRFVLALEQCGTHGVSLIILEIRIVSGCVLCVKIEILRESRCGRRRCSGGGVDVGHGGTVGFGRDCRGHKVNRAVVYSYKRHRGTEVRRAVDANFTRAQPQGTVISDSTRPNHVTKRRQIWILNLFSQLSGFITFRSRDFGGKKLVPFSLLHQQCASGHRSPKARLDVCLWFQCLIPALNRPKHISARLQSRKLHPDLTPNMSTATTSQPQLEAGHRPAIGEHL